MKRIGNMGTRSLAASTPSVPTAAAPTVLPAC